MILRLSKGLARSAWKAKGVLGAGEVGSVGFSWKNGVRDALFNTFASEEQLAQKEREKIKKQAEERELALEEERKKWEGVSEEELEKLQELIPEHRKGRLVMVESKDKNQVEGFSDKIKRKLRERYEKTEFYKKVRDSEEFKESEEV